MWLVMTWMVGCGGEPSTCRPETVLQFGEATTNYEGSDWRTCDLWLSRCDDGSDYSVDCSNDTFEGTYECMCISGVFGGFSTFESAGICDKSDGAIIDEAIAGCGWDVVIEP